MSAVHGADQEDVVVPIGVLDASRGNTDIVLHLSLVISEQLSFTKLEESWYALVSAWPIIWARTRKSSTSLSGFDFHIPSEKRVKDMQEKSASQDPEDRPFYCLDEGHRSLASYFGGLQSPSLSVRTNVFTTPAPSGDDEIRIMRFNAVTKFDDLLNSDRPLISVQVSRFSDATLISLSMSHIMGDGFAIGAMLRAWQDTLKTGTPPAPLQDLGYDALTAFHPSNLITKPPKTPPGYTLFNFWQKAQFIGNFLYDCLIPRPESKMEQRYVFVPNEEITRLEAQAKEDLQSKGEGPEFTHLSRSDVLYSWLMKHSHAGLPRKWISTPLSIINARRRLPTGASPFPQHPFYGAAYAVPLDSLPIGDLLDLPLGELGRHVRRSHMKHVDPDISRDHIAFQMYFSSWTADASKKGFPMFCGSNDRWSGLTDWRAMKLFQVDFTPAIESSSSSLSSSASGSHTNTSSAVSSAMNVQMSCAMSKRDRWCCLGDSKDGVWISGYLSKDQWSNLDGFGRYEVVSLPKST